MGQSGVWWRPRSRARADSRPSREGLACPGQQGRGERSGKGQTGRGWAVRRRAISCSSPGGAAKANLCSVFVDSKFWVTPLLRRRGAGLGEDGRGSRRRAAWAMWGWARGAGGA